MTYKKYIKKKVNGKVRVYGPYYYKSYRDKDGKVKTLYVAGPDDKPSDKKVSFKTIMIIALCLLISVFFAFSLIYGFHNILDEGYFEISDNKNVISYFLDKPYNLIVGFAALNDWGNITDKETDKEEDDETLVTLQDENLNQSRKDNESSEDSENQTNITSPDDITNQTNITSPDIGNLSSEANISFINQTNLNGNLTIKNNVTNRGKSNISLPVEIKRAKIVIGKPVKWIKKIRINKSISIKNLTVNLHKDATNISIKTGQEVKQAEKEIQKEQENISEINKMMISAQLTGKVSLEFKKEKGILTRFWEWLIDSLSITGNIIHQQELEQQGKIKQTEKDKEINLSDIVEQQKQEEQEIAVEYYTQAPESREENLSNGKRITISAPSELNYTDILAYTILDNPISIDKEHKIKVLWNNKETGEKEQVNRNCSDLDNDGFIDYVEWEIPELSEQIYEIIYITKAEHLDENRTFIEDVYEDVKELDGNYTTIPNEHFIRVEFEKNLTKDNDITLYARSEKESEIEVYTENSSELITKFENISYNNQSFNKYKVYLTNLSECYDNKTKILTENGWKYFSELGNEKVLTLNQKTGEAEYQSPTAKQIYEYDGEMYKIETEQGDLIVSPEHRVYVSDYDSNSIISPELNTFTSDCCLNLGSLDQIGQFNLSASAKKGMSLSCINFSACDSNFLNENFGTIVIILNNSDNFSLNCFELSPEYFNISDLFFFNSSTACSGQNNCKFADFDEEMISLTGFGRKNETSILESITSFIYQPSCLYFSHIPCLILSPILNASFSNSLSEFNCFNISCFQINRDTLASTYFLKSPDQLISGNCSIFSLSSSGKDIVRFFILSQNIQKTQIFKSFGSKDLSDFSLNKITDVYSDFNSGKEIYFLDENGEKVKVLNITKQPYKGKIYDVDVENDVVLVRRDKNKENKKQDLERGLEVWSGNSDSHDTFDLKVLGSVVEIDYVVDPTEYNETDNTVWECGNLTTANVVYTLNQSITTTETCIRVQATNVTFDMGGNTIGCESCSDSNYGIENIGAYNYSTIKNGSIKDFAKGIYINNSKSHKISNITIINSTLSGITISYSPNSIIQNNTFYNASINISRQSNNFTIQYNYIENYNGSQEGISVNNAYSGTIKNNEIHNSKKPINLYGPSSYSINIMDNVVRGCGDNSSSNKGCISIISGANDINVSKGSINCSECRSLFYFQGDASNNTLRDVNILSTSSDYLYGVEMYNDSTNNTFINVSYYTGSEIVADESELIRKWWYRAYVNDTNGIRVSNANITSYNVSGDYQFNLTSNASGWTQKQEIIDYRNINGTMNYYSNYTIYAENSTYMDESVSYNVTDNENNLEHNIELSAAGKTACGILDKENTVYTLQNDITGISGTCFTILANNITLDMNGHNISGDDDSGDYGVYAEGYNSSTIKNGEIYDFGRGIYLKYNENNNITEITTNSNTNYGLYLDSSSNNNITNITANSNGLNGIYLDASSNNQLTNIIANLNDYGIRLSSSSDNTLQDITANENSWDGLYFDASSNNTLQDITANSNSYGFNIKNSDNSNITNITVNENLWYGLYLDASSNNQLTNLNFWRCSIEGVYGCISIVESDTNIIENAKINKTKGPGMWIFSSGAGDHSSHNIFRDINITNVDSYDVYFDDNSNSKNLNNTFINAIYDSDSESVSSNSELIRKGYFKSIIANVTYYDGETDVVQGENVSLKNDSDDVLDSNISNINGLATLDLGSEQLLKFYTNDRGTKNHHLYFYIVNSSSDFLAQTINPSWNSLLNQTSKIDEQIQDIKMDYRIYRVGGIQTIHDVYTNINSNDSFINVSSVSEPCHYIVNVTLFVYGTLISEGCTLEMNTLSSFSADLRLESGGKLIMNYTNITAGIRNGGLNYAFYTYGGNLILKNSYVEYIGVIDVPGSGRGLEINSTYLTFNNVTIKNSKGGVFLLAPNLTISNSRISGSSSSIFGDNVRVEAPGARIVDCNLSDPGLSRNDIYISAGKDVSVVNSNYSILGFESGAKLYRKWWYEAYVNDTFDNNVSNANITFYNVSGDYQFNLTTNTSGWIPKTELIDYIQNSSGDKDYYSNYTIYARNSSYTYIDSKSVNISAENNIPDHVFTLDNPPSVSLVSVSSNSYKYNVIDGNSIINCSLILSGSNVASDNNVSNNGAEETISYSTPVGTYSYYITCIDDLGEIGNSSSSTISVSERRTDGSSGGGGGGGTSTLSIKITMPPSKSIYETGIITLPITIKNIGNANFNEINLSSYVFEKGKLRQDIKTDLDIYNLSSLASGQEKNLTLKVTINENKTTTYNVVLNVTSKNPSYDTQSTTHISFVGENLSGVRKMIVFANETIVGNPECLELREMLDEAEQLYKQGKDKEAMELSRKAVEACKSMLEGPKKDRYSEDEFSTGTKIIIYLAIGLGVAILFGFLFNLIRKIIFNKRLDKFKQEQQPQKNQGNEAIEKDAFKP